MLAMIANFLITAPQEITPQWEKEVLGVQYACPTVAQAVEEMTQGICGDVFTELPLEITETGEYVSYWDNGQVKVRLPYKDGKPHGHLHGWYKDGKDAFKGYFQNGIKQGIHMSFYFERNKDRCLEYNLQGHLESKQTYWYKTGEFLAIRYKDGVAYGPLECWDKDSKLLLSVEYKKGKLQKNPPPPPAKRPRQKLPVYEGYIDEVVRGCKKFGYRIMGDSGKAPWDVERVGAMFEVPEKVTLQQARALVTKLKKGMSDEVNAHEKIRPYLREYPFSPQRTDIDIEFTKADGEVDRVSHCSWYDEIRYWKGKTCICVETYEEAVRALR